MSGIRLDGDELVERCSRCGGECRSWVTETVVGDGIWSSVSMRCAGCGAASEACGPEEVRGIHREALIAGVGLARVYADPVVNRPLRPRLLAVFRRQGGTIADAVAAYARLTGEGITGTPARTQLLADRLTAAGATVTVEPPERW